jgi:hypothetical protein
MKMIFLRKMKRLGFYTIFVYMLIYETDFIFHKN